MHTLISTTPQVSIVTASKSMVDKLLSMNTRNRTPKKDHMARIKRDIESGTFHLTASGIGVSKTGVLLDGQNRLMAIRDAGYPPVKFVLATGLDDDSQRVVDRHAKRSLSDALSMHMNITVSSHMVALAHALRSFNATRKPPQPFAYAHGHLSDSEVGDFMAEYGDVAIEVVRSATGCRAPVMAAIFVYALHDHERALQFARDVAKGVNLAEDNPAFRLRSSMARLKTASDAAGRMELFRVAASACINHANNKNLKLLRAADSWDGARWQWAVKGPDIFSEPGTEEVTRASGCHISPFAGRGARQAAA